MKTYNLALLGFGNVGQALARLLLYKRDALISRYGIAYKITGIATSRHGTAIDPRGIDSRRALEVSKGENLSELSDLPKIENSFDFIRGCGADVLFENTPVNYQDGLPAVDHLRLALELGMHAVTANKGPVVHAYRHLTELAKKVGKKFYFESSVMDGAPIFSLFRGSLPATQLLSFKAVLNSTTNMILTRMEQGETFESAVAYTQQIGIAETDPSGDIDGWDAAVKVAALVTVLMGIPLKPQEVKRTGIRNISLMDVLQAKSNNQRYKLVCSATRTNDGIRANVAPELVSVESPLFQVQGTTSMITFETDVLGSLTMIEENPGPHTTAYGLLADFINAVT